MRILNDFSCELGHVHEMLVDRDIQVMTCPDCGKPSAKMLSAPKTVKINGYSSYIDTKQWEKDRIKKIKKEREHGEG